MPIWHAKAGANYRPSHNWRETAKSIRSPHLKIAALEMTWYMRRRLLRDSDWASMAHSLEIRVPLVDVQLLRSLAPLFRGKSPTPNQA